MFFITSRRDPVIGSVKLTVFLIFIVSLCIFCARTALAQANDANDDQAVVTPDGTNPGICYPFSSINRVENICIPSKRYPDPEITDANLEEFSLRGDLLSLNLNSFSKCVIDQRIEIPNPVAQRLDSHTFNDLTIACPSSESPDRRYVIRLQFNNTFYLPLMIHDEICGPQTDGEGSGFDQYVRSKLGSPSKVDKDALYITGYYWFKSHLILKISKTASDRIFDYVKCPQAQNAWSIDFGLNQASGASWNAYKVRQQTEFENNNFTPFAGPQGPRTPTQDATLGYKDGQHISGENGRVYQYISAPGISWHEAADRASRLEFNGKHGYLAVITSDSELRFIENRVIPGGAIVGNVYIGGERVAGTTATWKWAAGPEAGTIFWQNGPKADRFTPWDPVYALGAGAPAGPDKPGQSFLYLNGWYRPYLTSNTGAALDGVNQGGNSGFVVEY